MSASRKSNERQMHMLIMITSRYLTIFRKVTDQILTVMSNSNYAKFRVKGHMVDEKANKMWIRNEKKKQEKHKKEKKIPKFKGYKI